MMVEPYYHYSQVPLAQISKGLKELFAGVQTETGVKTTLTANSNLILLLSATDLFSEMDDLINSLVLIHPCRFFVVAVDDSLEEMYAEIAARCHGLSEHTQVCSEVVRLSCPSKRLQALPELIRANLVPGTPTELLLCDSAVNQTLLQIISTLADRIFLDSSGMEGNFESLLSTAKLSPRIVDLSWVALSIWREQIKTAFDNETARSYLSGLRSIKIESIVPEHLNRDGHVPMAALLMAGWLVSRLGLEPHGYADCVFQNIYKGSQVVALELQSSSGSPVPSLTGVTMVLDGPAGKETCQIELKRGQQLETSVKMQHNLRVSRPFEDETQLGILRRYFQIGDFSANYGETLLAASKLLALQQAP
jgi:glucose-6-phosphate dehydrogenase assembly protein OpcA